MQRNFILCEGGGRFSLFLLLFRSVSVHTFVVMASQRSRRQISAFVTARTGSSNYLSNAAAVRNDERVASLRRTEETKVLLVENNGKISREEKYPKGSQRPRPLVCRFFCRFRKIKLKIRQPSACQTHQNQIHWA